MSSIKILKLLGLNSLKFCSLMWVNLTFYKTYYSSLAFLCASTQWKWSSTMLMLVMTSLTYVINWCTFSIKAHKNIFKIWLGLDQTLLELTFAFASKGQKSHVQ